MGMRVGMMPDSEDPKPKESEAHDEPGKPTELSIEEFHERADHYLGELLQRLEEAQENDPAIEVDYSVSHFCTRGSLEQTSFLVQHHDQLDTNSITGRRP
jgi:frataxin